MTDIQPANTTTIPDAPRRLESQIVLPGGIYDTEQDLDRLVTVYRDGAEEAAVFYAGRLFDAVTARAIVDLGLDPGSNAFGNLCFVQELNLLSPTLAGFAHCIRRSSNAVRHLTLCINRGDTEVVVACLRWVLDWYWCRFRFGPRMPSESDRVLGLEQLPPASVVNKVGRLARHEMDRRELDAVAIDLIHHDGNPSPYLYSLTIEPLVAIGDPAAMASADVLLGRAMSRYPNDLRIWQLKGLWYSRNGQLDEAVQALEVLKEDEETIGILGGVLKRRWWNDQSETDSLKKSHSMYSLGFSRTRPASAYLGINAASTAMLLGEREKARATARKVVTLLQQRHDLLVRLAQEPDCGLGYWDEVTLAEAHLLLGELQEARRLYLEAFSRFPALAGHQRSTRSQLSSLLNAMELGAADENFLAGRRLPTSNTGATP